MILLGYIRVAKIDSFTLWSRLTLWGILFFVFVIVILGEKKSIASLGFAPFGRSSFVAGISGAIILMIVFPITQLVFNKVGLSKQETAYNELTKYSVNYRAFIVITAAVVEELLYRGYAIERTSLITGNIWIASLVSVCFFTAAHIWSWSLRHLLSVAIAGTILTILYVIQRDIVACMIAHVIIDGVGFIVMPAILAKKATNA